MKYLPEVDLLVQYLPRIHNKQILLFYAIIVLIFLFAYIINMLLLGSIGGIYRVFVAPGVIVHEMSHALGCVLTGAKINSMQVFKKDGGEVRHTQPKIPIIGQIIISMAPFVVGFILVYLLAKFVGVKPLDTDILNSNISDNTIKQIWDAIKGVEYKSLVSWVALYLIISISVTMTPSTRDLLNMCLSLIIVAVLVFLLIKYMDVNINLSAIANPQFLAILATTALVLLVVLILSIMVAVISSIFKK